MGGSCQETHSGLLVTLSDLAVCLLGENFISLDRIMQITWMSSTDFAEQPTRDTTRPTMQTRVGAEFGQGNLSAVVEESLMGNNGNT